MGASGNAFRSAWEKSLGRIPLFTRITFLTCLSFQLLVRWRRRDAIGNVCLSADAIIFYRELGRILLAPTFHEGWKHLLPILAGIVWIGVPLEKHMGTIHLAYLNTILSIFGAVLYLLLAYVRAINPIKRNSIAPYECVVGMSSILLGQLAVRCKTLGNVRRSFFGLFLVPTRWYPLATLVLAQLLLPSSFTWDLSGLVVGTIYAYGGFDWLKLDAPFVEYLEKDSPARCLVHRGGYIAQHSNSPSCVPSPGFQLDLFGRLMHVWKSRIGFGLFRRKKESDDHEEVRIEEKSRNGSRPYSSNLPFMIKSSRQSVHSSSSAGTSSMMEGKQGHIHMQMRAIKDVLQDPKYEDKMSALVEMGYDAPLVREALEAAGGDVSTAAELLTR